MLCLEYVSFNFLAILETSILSTKRIVSIAGMDTTLLAVVLKVTTIAVLWMKLKLPYGHIDLLILLFPFFYRSNDLKDDSYFVLLWSDLSFRLLLLSIDKFDSGWESILLCHW